jgi:hypothetical protein
LRTKGPNDDAQRTVVAVVMIGAALAACSTESPSTPNPSATPQAQSQAADLRTHLDLLLSEQVMIVAKESAAAVNHSDEYAGYTGLLSTNSADLAALIGRAFGTTASIQFAQAWNIQNGYLVDYAIGVVTHNDAKANGAMSGLTNGFIPQFAQVVSDTSGLPLDPVAQLTSQQVLEDKAFIDDVFAGRYATYYSDLHRAYVQTSRFGDALAAQVAHDFPDKFQGDPSAHLVDVRVSFNELLQEHSYLATMATDAVLANRNSEKTAAAAALATNGDMLGTAFSTAFGNSVGTQFDKVWAARDAALVGYASGDATAKQSLTATFVAAFAPLAKVGRSQVASQVAATLKVIDDQRAKSGLAIAGDDRAAATAMQPIADSVQS